MYEESCIILSHCPTTISDGGSQINKLAAVVVRTVVDHHGRLLEDIKPLYFAAAVLSFFMLLSSYILLFCTLLFPPKVLLDIKPLLVILFDGLLLFSVQSPLPPLHLRLI